VRDISGGVQSLLSQAENAISRHERGECVVDELRLLYSTLPKHGDDVRALGDPTPNCVLWLDSLAATRSAVGVLCGLESGGSVDESDEDVVPVGPQMYRLPAIGVESDMSCLLERATRLLTTAKRACEYLHVNIHPCLRVSVCLSIHACLCSPVCVVGLV
jgi:hypothetical protein